MSQPHVELLTGDLSHEALSRIDDRVIGSERELIASGLMQHRMLVINHAKREAAKASEITGKTLLAIVETASELYLGRLSTVVGPAAANAYVRAYRDAEVGDVPMSTIYALADDHTKRIGRYYDETSKEALVQGFNTFVNRQLPARVAAERALDAYGLTPRQMGGYTSLDTTQKVASAAQQNLKARATEYIGRSIRQRVKIFSEQESHNLDLQAKQTAWLWLQQNGGLGPSAFKVWLTAKDELTCVTCAPMHGKKVAVGEKFELPSGMQVWTAGVHPNCRCDVRVVDPMRDEVSKNLTPKEIAEREAARANNGRFGVQDRTRQDHAMATAPTSPAVAPQQGALRPVNPALVRSRNEARGALTQEQAARYEEMAARLKAVREGARTQFKPMEEGLKLNPVQSALKLNPVQPALKIPTERLALPVEESQPAWEGRDELLPVLKPAPAAVGLPALKPAPKQQQKQKMVRPLGSTWYHVETEGDANDPARYFSDASFTNSRAQAVLSAANWRKEQMDAKFNQLTDNGSMNATYSFWDPNENRHYRAVVDQADLRRIISVIAGQSVEGLMPGDFSDHYIDVDLYDADSTAHYDSDYEGERDYEMDDDGGGDYALGTQRVSISQLGIELDLRPEQFETRVIAIDSVHNEPGGRGGAQHFSSSKSGNEYLAVKGEYEIYESDYEPLSDADHGVDVYFAKPFDPAWGNHPDNYNE